MTDPALIAISPVDGRYRAKADPLRDTCSEFGLIRYRVYVEAMWFAFLADEPAIEELPALSASARTALEQLVDDFDVDDAAAVKAIEATTNHDVKAVEYWLKQALPPTRSWRPAEFVHFACTSKTSQPAYALLVRDARDRAVLPAIDDATGRRRPRPRPRGHADALADPRPARLADDPRKEIANVVARLRTQRARSPRSRPRRSTARSATSTPTVGLPEPVAVSGPSSSARSGSASTPRLRRSSRTTGSRAFDALARAT